MPTGGSTEVREVVTQELSLDVTCASFDYAAVLQALAAQYAVDASLVSFADPCPSTGRRLRARAMDLLACTHCHARCKELTRCKAPRLAAKPLCTCRTPLYDKI